MVPHLRDPHPRVRHAACNAIGQMCTDFGPKIQEKHHQIILSNLIPVMEDLQNIRYFFSDKVLQITPLLRWLTFLKMSVKSVFLHTLNI